MRELLFNQTHEISGSGDVNFFRLNEMWLQREQQLLGALSMELVRPTGAAAMAGVGALSTLLEVQVLHQGPAAVVNLLRYRY